MLNLHFINRSNTLRKTFFKKKKKILSSSSYFEPNAVGKAKSFLLQSINCKLQDQRNFFGNFSWVSSSYFIYFGLLSKTSRSVCQNCFQWALRIVSEKKKQFSDIEVLSMTFGPTAKFFKVLGQKFSCGASKLHFMFPKKRYIEEEQFLEKPIAFLFIFRPWTKTSLTFVEKNAA